MRGKIMASERDAICAELRAVMLRHQISPHYVYQMARIAAEEARDAMRRVSV